MRKPILALLFAIVAACGLLFNPLGHTAPAYASVRKLTALAGGVIDFRLSPNGQWVLFRLLRNDTVSLYSVPIQGGPARRLASPILSYARLAPMIRTMYAISPDSQRVLYFGMPSPAATPTPPAGGAYVEHPGFGLYSVPIDGSTASSLIVDDPNIHAFGFSPDAQRAIYATGTGTTNAPGEIYRFDLYSKPIAGGTAERLNIDLATGQSVAFDRFSILPSGYVVYGLGALSYTYPYGPSMGLVDLYRVPIAGPSSQSVKLNPCGPVHILVNRYVVSQDGQRIVLNGSDCDGGGVLRSLPITGGAATRLSPAGDTRIPQTTFITEDQRFVVYTLPHTVNQQTVRDLYIAPLTGPSSAIHLVQSGSPSGVDPQLVGDAPNGDWLAFSSGTALYVAARTWASDSPQLVTTNHVASSYALISADSRYLIYQETGGMLRSLQLGSSSSSSLSLGLPATDYSRLYRRAGANRILIRNHADGHLYTAPAGGPAAALIRVSHTPVDYYSGPTITPDGTAVVYISDEDGQLYVTDIDAAYTAPTPVFQLPQGCGNSPSPITTTGPTRIPFATEYPIFIPGLQQCYPEP